jgi:hypothetical protein
MTIKIPYTHPTDFYVFGTATDKAVAGNGKKGEKIAEQTPVDSLPAAGQFLHRKLSHP